MNASFSDFCRESLYGIAPVPHTQFSLTKTSHRSRLRIHCLSVYSSVFIRLKVMDMLKIQLFLKWTLWNIRFFIESIFLYTGAENRSTEFLSIRELMNNSWSPLFCTEFVGMVIHSLILVFIFRNESYYITNSFCCRYFSIAFKAVLRHIFVKIIR